MTARSDSILRDRLSCSAPLRHFDIWQATVAVVSSCAVAALLAWTFFWPEPLGPLVWAGTVFSVFAVIGLAVSLVRVEAGTLRRQQGRWTFAPDATPESEPRTGELFVALDLGSFMLLAFISVSGYANRKTTRWLPAQRRGLASDWHALRAAVHAPRSQGDTALRAASSTE